MAKKATKAQLEAEVEVKALVLIPADAEANAIKAFVPFDEQLKALITECESLPPITDKSSLEQAENLSKKIRKYEIAVEKTRLESVRPINEVLKNLKAHCDGMVSQAEAKRKELDDKINAEQIRLQEEARQEHLRREKYLSEFGWKLVGEFYSVGAHRVPFDMVDTATAEQLEKWAQMGAAVLEEERIRKEQEEARLREIEQREAALRAQEAEMAEFRAWKAAQAAAAAPQQEPTPTPTPETVAETHQPITKTLFDQPAAEPAKPAMQPSKEFVSEPAPKQTTVTSIDQLAQMRSTTVEFLKSTPEFRVFYNIGITEAAREYVDGGHRTAESYVSALKAKLIS
jgi:hypothetical protein